MIDADLVQIEKFTRDLGKFAVRAVPFAERAAMNDAAFATRVEVLRVLDTKFIMRNTFTKRSIQVVRATGKAPQAVIGSTAGYMLDQEFGAVKMAKGKQGVGIATSYASGEGLTARPRKKLPRKPNRMRNIQLNHTSGRSMTRKQRTFVKIRETMASGRKFVYLDLGRTKGVFRVTGKGKRGKIKMVADLSRKSVVIKPKPWLRPSVDKIRPRVPQMFIDQLERQVQRQRLFLEKRGL